MTTPIIHFRTAYVAQQTKHDFKELLNHCDKVTFVTTGLEPQEELLDTIRVNLEEFDPREDVLVPVGNNPVNVLFGMVALTHLNYQKPVPFGLAVFQDKEYHFVMYNLWDVFDKEGTNG